MLYKFSNTIRSLHLYPLFYLSASLISSSFLTFIFSLLSFILLCPALLHLKTSQYKFEITLYSESEHVHYISRQRETATSNWFEIWGSWIRVKKFNFLGKFPIFQAISQTKNQFFRANFRKISISFG